MFNDVIPDLYQRRHLKWWHNTILFETTDDSLEQITVSTYFFLPVQRWEEDEGCKNGTILHLFVHVKYVSQKSRHLKSNRPEYFECRVDIWINTRVVPFLTCAETIPIKIFDKKIIKYSCLPGRKKGAYGYRK